jgi:hypothetical protein
MTKVINRSLVFVLFLTTMASIVAAYQVEPFSLKLNDGEEITVFTYRQNDDISIALRIVGPGEAQVFISAIYKRDTGTMVTITPSGGHPFKLQRSPGKAVVVMDDQERPLANSKLLAQGSTFFDQIETLRQAVAARVSSNSSVNADAVGTQSLRDIATSARLFEEK